MAQIITFAQQKGGAGKTTLLVHLAHAWSLAGRKVAAIDLDPQGSLTAWLEFGKLPLISAITSRDYRASADIRSAAAGHDLVLVDCPGKASSLLEAAIRASGLVLVPCQPSALDIWASNAVLQMAASEKTPAAVALNRASPRSPATPWATAELQKSGAHVLASRLGNRVAFSKGQISGETALSRSSASAAATEVLALRQEIEALLA